MTELPFRAPLRLREKLLISGVTSLSDTELLAIFISSGTRQKSCLQLAAELLHYFGDLRALINAPRRAFNAIHGFGDVRYTQLQATRELCRRSDFISLQKNFQLHNYQDTYVFLKRKLRDKKNETCVALFLDSQYRIITYEELFHGSISNAFIHPRPLVERVLQLNAAALILAHNHPSGLCQPSEDDVTITQRVKQALQLIDTQLLDHLVIGDNEVYSIANKTKWPCH